MAELITVLILVLLIAGLTIWADAGTKRHRRLLTARILFLINEGQDESISFDSLFGRLYGYGWRNHTHDATSKRVGELFTEGLIAGDAKKGILLTENGTEQLKKLREHKHVKPTLPAANRYNKNPLPSPTSGNAV